MTTDPAERLDLAPELRMVSYTYREVFGRPPAMLWRVPGTVTLLADGPLRLTVATPWGAIAAAGPRDDDVIELAHMERPGQPECVTITEAAAGSGPAWTGTGLRSARRGTALLVTSGLPEGAGVGAGAATETAIRLCLGDATDPGAPERPDVACAMLGERQLPFDLAAAGLRLMIIDTRVRGAAQPAPAEYSPMAVAAKAISAGDITAIGPLLTAAHKSLDCDDAQHIAVSTALRAGAYGARMITDGPGRPVCALVPVGRLADVRAGVSAWFTRRRLRSPRFLTFTPASGPRWFGTIGQA